MYGLVTYQNDIYVHKVLGESRPDSLLDLNILKPHVYFIAASIHIKVSQTKNTYNRDQ